MEAARSRKETVAIAFFWVAFGVMVVTALVNLAVESGRGGGPASSAAPARDVMPPGERIAQIKAFLEENPDKVEALVALGDLYFEADRVSEAIEVFERAEALEPRSVHILNDLGMLYQRRGDYDAAIEKFRSVLEVSPDHLSSLLNIGMIYRYSKGDDEKALRIFQEVLSKNPEARIREMAAEEIRLLKAEKGS